MCVSTGERMFSSPCSSRGSHGDTTGCGCLGGVHEACTSMKSYTKAGYAYRWAGRMKLGLSRLIERQFALTRAWRDGLSTGSANAVSCLSDSLSKYYSLYRSFLRYWLRIPGPDCVLFCLLHYLYIPCFGGVGKMLGSLVRWSPSWVR